MQSLIKPLFIGGVFLLFAFIVGAHQQNPHRGVIIEQLTAPYPQIKSPFWDRDTGKLYMSVTNENQVICLNTATGQLTYANLTSRIANGTLGSVVPVEGEPELFVAGVGTDFVLFRWNSDTNCTNPVKKILGTVDTDKIGTSFSDGACDSHGRFWAGTRGSHNKSAPLGINPDGGSVYQLTSDLVIKKKISPVTASDGTAWNKENTKLYYIDAASYEIVAYDFDAHHGHISNERIVLDLIRKNISGIPDGVAVDTNGNLWVAMFATGHIINVDPKHGKVLRTIQMPTNGIVSLAFGGHSYDILYVTSNTVRLPILELDGSAFAVKGLGVRGFPPNKFSLDKKLAHARHLV